MADTLGLAYRWMAQRLAGSGTLTTLVAGRTYRKIAPQAAVLPAVVYNVLSWRDFTGLGGHRCSGRGIVTAAGLVAARDMPTLVSIMNELDTLFHNVQGDSFQSVLWTCMRVEQWDDLSEVEGKEFSMLGGRFELTVVGL